MKRLHVRYGLKERLNDIIGTDQTGWGGESVPSITPWSVQSVINENIKRLCLGLSGDSGTGRVLSGLWLSYNNSTLTISKGYGVTGDGEIIGLETGWEITDLVISTGTTYGIWLKYTESAVDGDKYSDGKKVNFIGKSGSQDIVYDNALLAAHDDLSNLDSGSIVVLEEDEPSAKTGHLYLGNITISGTTATISYEYRRCGFAPDDDNNMIVPSNLHVSGTLTVAGDTDFESIVLEGSLKSITIKEHALIKIEEDGTLTTDPGSNMNIGGNVTASSNSSINLSGSQSVSLPSGSGYLKVGTTEGYTGNVVISGTTLGFTNGILTSVTL